MARIGTVGQANSFFVELRANLSSTTYLMPFISSHSKDSNASNKDEIEFITDQQVRAMFALNWTSDHLQSSEHPARCIKCGAKPECLQDVMIDNCVFACRLKVPVCRRCAGTHPFDPLEVNGSTCISGALLAIAIGSWMVSQVLFGLIFLLLAGAAIFFLPPYCFLSRRQRQIRFLKLLQASDRYQRLVSVIPNTNLLLPLDNNHEGFTDDREVRSLRDSFGWKSGFNWILVDHQFALDTASIAVISALLENLVEELTLLSLEYQGRKDFILRLKVELLDRQRRILGLDSLPRLPKRKIEQFIRKADALPPIVVNGPILIHLYYAKALGTELFGKLPKPNVSPELLEFAELTMKRRSTSRSDVTLHDPTSETADRSAKKKLPVEESELGVAGVTDSEQRVKSGEDTEKFTLDQLLVWQKAAPNQLHLLSVISDKLLDLSRTDEAIQLWEKFIADNKVNSDARFQYAVLLEKAGYLERAAGVCKKLTEDEPDNTDAFGLLAHLLLQLDQANEAAEILQRSPQRGQSLDFLMAEARVYIALDDKEQMGKTIEKMKAYFPEAATTWYFSAVKKIQQEYFLEALDEIERLEKVIGLNWTVVQMRSHCLYQLGRSNEALAIVEAAVEKEPENVALRLLRAEYYYGMNKFELAIEDYARVLEIEPENTQALQLLASTYLANGDCASAITYGQRAMELTESSSYLLGLLGTAHLMNQDIDVAENYLGQACDADATNYQARYRLSQLRAYKGDFEQAIDELNVILKDHPDEAAILLTRGYNYLSLRQHEQAIFDFDLVIESQPNSLAALRGKAIALEAMEKRKDALEFYDKALTVDPDDADSLVGRSRLSMSDNKLEAAEKDLNSVLESMPDSIQVLYMRAQVSMHAGKLDQAMNDFNEILRNDPDFTPALIGRSAVWNQKGEIEKSQDDLDAAIQSAPEHAEESDYSRLLQIAQLAFVQEKYQEALTAVNEAIDICQQDPLQAIRIRAGVYCYLDHFAEAIEDYNRLIESAESREPGLLNGRGQTYCELGEYELALADLEEAVELARKSEYITLLAYTLNGLGKTLVGLGRYDEAQVAFDESFSLQPKNSWLQFNQGLMAAVRNQPLKAVEFFEKALELHDPVLSPKKRAKAKAFIDRYSRQSSEDKPSHD